jgi:hypothetical protein
VVLHGQEAFQQFGMGGEEWIHYTGIFGRSGSGKTNTAFLVVRNFLARRKPFLVFDWKRNYRDLVSLVVGGESSEVIKRRVNAATLVQQERFRRSKIHCNAQMPPRLLRRACELDRDSQRLLETAIDKLGLSARAHNRILKIARTIVTHHRPHCRRHPLPQPGPGEHTLVSLRARLESPFSSPTGERSRPTSARSGSFSSSHPGARPDRTCTVERAWVRESSRQPAP